MGLAALARRAGVAFGTAVGLDGLSQPAEVALYAREASIVTVDPDLLLPFLRPRPATFTPERADRIVDLARGHGLAVRGHALVWNDNVPDWIKRLSQRERAAFFDRHIEETVQRFHGRLHSWDVVNEPIFPPQLQAENFRLGPWLDTFGTGYVARAFERAARVADPDCKLTLNEAFTEREDELGLATRRGLLRLIDQLKDKGVRIDAIGLQGHLEADKVFDPGSFRAFLHEIERRGLDIYLTEVDVNDLELDGTEAERDEIVAGRYRSLIETALTVPAVKVIVTWQLADHRSWLRNPWFTRTFPARKRRFPARALPYDDALKPKLAREAIASAFRAARL